MLTPDQLTQYATNGYVVLPSLLAADEVAAFRDAARTDLERQAAGGDVMHKADAEGNVTLLKLWNQAGDDLYGRVAATSASSTSRSTCSARTPTSTATR